MVEKPICPRCGRSEFVDIIETRVITCSRCGKEIAILQTCFCRRCNHRWIARKGEAYTVIENKFFCMDCTRFVDEKYRLELMPVDTQVDLALKILQIIEKAQALGLPCEAFRKLYARIEKIRAKREEILDKEHEPVNPVELKSRSSVLAEIENTIKVMDELEKRGVPVEKFRKHLEDLINML